MSDAAPKRYTVKLLPSAQRDSDDLEKKMFSRVVPALKSLVLNPRPYGSIKMSADEGHRLRVGSHRIVYRIEDKARMVFVYRIKHCREVYR